MQRSSRGENCGHGCAILAGRNGAGNPLYDKAPGAENKLQALV